MRSALRNMAALFFGYHVLAIAAANFPDGNIVKAIGLVPFQPYLESTGQLQSWDMFDAKPDDERYEVTAFVVDAEQRETRVGPIVPGLKEFRPTLKLTSFFYRIHPEADGSETAWATYADRLCREVRAQRGPAPVTLWVDFISYRLHTLEQIRADGVLSEKYVATRGPVACLF